MCSNKAINGVTRNGGYGQYATLRTEAAVRVPKDAEPADVAPLLCAGVTVFNGIRNMGIMAGDIVAVQGLGGLGHLAIQYARKMGYRTVALSRGTEKKDFAMKLGANDYIDIKANDVGEELQKLGGAACIVVTAPNPDVSLSAFLSREILLTLHRQGHLTSAQWSGTTRQAPRPHCNRPCTRQHGANGTERSFRLRMAVRPCSRFGGRDCVCTDPWRQVHD